MKLCFAGHPHFHVREIYFSLLEVLYFFNKFQIMFTSWCHSVLAVATSVCFITRAIYVGKSNMGLTFVPQNISIQVTNLNLANNRIIRVTNMSFVLFKELRILRLTKNGLNYIENGTFDHNAKLENIFVGSNSIRQLPHSFGLAATSLKGLDLWCSLRYPAGSNINFTEMTNLEWINIGCTNLHGVFDASRLPRMLKTVGVNFAKLTQFPDFARYTPKIVKIMLTGNKITEVPSEYVADNSDLRMINFDRNSLSTVPDLYHLPLTRLHMSRNPFVCDQSLCWVRMWPWMKRPAHITDRISCATPGFLQGALLMDINPITLGCQNGAGL